MEGQVEGKVAAIVNERTIVINCGEKEGVEENMLFDIFIYGGELEDPETGESLGALEDVKAKGRVIHVQERMSTLLRIPLHYDEDETEETFINPRMGIKPVEIGDCVRNFDGFIQMLHSLHT